jgi:hypothetical protein
MSDKQFEPCTLGDATHVEVNGKVYLLGGKEVELEDYHGERIGIRWQEGDVFIPVDAFPILGIKLFKEVKPEPVEFEATFAMYDGKWHPLYSWNAGVSYQNSKKATFKCVQILEEEE